MTEPSYPAARAVAPKVQAHFARHLAAAGAGFVGTLPLAPDATDIETLVDAAFWASLKREEGFVPKISLALLSPDRTSDPMMFARPLPLAPIPLVRVAPAVERPGIHLGVWRIDGELRVWGTTQSIPGILLRARGIGARPARGEASSR